MDSIDVTIGGLSEKTVCPVCLDDDGDQLALACRHRAHEECLQGIIKLECPLCRAVIKKDDVSEGLFRKITLNAKQRAEQLEMENLEAARRYASQHSETRVQMLLQMEILLALKYLYAIGIPESRMPREIDLQIDPTSPAPTEGSMFNRIVSRVLEMIQNEISDEPEEIDVGGDALPSIPEAEDDEEYPFSFERDAPLEATVIRTSPISTPAAMRAAREVPFLWNTIRFRLSEMDEIEVSQLRDWDQRRRRR